MHLPKYLQVAFCWCCHWDAGAVAAVLTERKQLIRWQHSCSTCLAGHSNYSYTSLPKNAIRALFSPKTCKWNWIDSRVGIAVLSKGNFKLGTTFPIPFCHCYHEFVMFVYLVLILFNPLWQGLGEKKIHSRLEISSHFLLRGAQPGPEWETVKQWNF